MSPVPRKLERVRAGWWRNATLSKVGCQPSSNFYREVFAV